LGGADRAQLIREVLKKKKEKKKTVVLACSADPGTAHLVMAGRDSAFKPSLHSAFKQVSVRLLFDRPFTLREGNFRNCGACCSVANAQSVSSRNYNRLQATTIQFAGVIN
jgi:REP element-mobilizing transposase RayT